MSRISKFEGNNRFFFTLLGQNNQREPTHGSWESKSTHHWLRNPKWNSCWHPISGIRVYSTLRSASSPLLPLLLTRQWRRKCWSRQRRRRPCRRSPSSRRWRSWWGRGWRCRPPGRSAPSPVAKSHKCQSRQLELWAKCVSWQEVKVNIR